MDENEEFEFRLRAEHEAGAAPPAAPPPVVASPAPKDGDVTPAAGAPSGFYSVTGDDGRKTLRRELGVGDIAQSALDMPLVGTAANAATGAYNLGVKAVAGIAGLLGGADTVHNVRDTLSVAPAQTKDPISQGLGAVQHGAEKLVAPLDAAVENLPDAPRTIIHGAEEAIPDVAALAPGLGGVRAAARPTALAESAAARGEKAALASGDEQAITQARGTVAPPAHKAVEGSVRASGEDVLGTLRAAGYKFRPSDVKAMKPGEKVPGIRREGLQDAAGLKKDFTLENQATTTKLAAEDLGAKGKTSLMEKDYEKLRAPHFKVYEDVEKAANLAPSLEYANALKDAQERAGLKGSASATESISALRRNARKRSRSDDVKANKEGETDMQVADSLEEQLGNQLKAQGDAKLMSDYVASRQALAKIHDYESATRGGQVDAGRMRSIDDKNPGRMTGNAKIISDAADYAKNVTRHSQNATGVKSSVKADTVAGMVKNAAGKVVSKLPGMDVSRSGFQNKFGREATPAERGSFADYGKRAPRPEPFEGKRVQPGSDSVDFTPTPGVPPARSLADELELAPEPVQNPVRLPEKPDTLTADVVPPVRGDIDFSASPDVSLAGDLGLMPERQAGGLDYTAAPMGDSGDLQLALADLMEQLGLRVDTPQPSLMTPAKAPVPFGPRVELERPPGRVGKPKKQKK